jgi:tRNA pseudouridine38-40 synthase
MRTIKITLAYDGTDFAGWQVQPDRKTIQGELAAAIERVCGDRVLPQGSGRTDAGVHALAQVASCSIAAPIPLDRLRFALNRTLPEAIRVLSVEEAAADFHARKCAKGKRYRYRLQRDEIVSPFVARYVWHNPFPMNEQAVFDAASYVVGEHDFSTFAAADPEKGHEEASNIRQIYSSEWRREDGELVYEVRGSGFLHHMVRNLVGTFIWVGKGTLRPSDIPRILLAKDRSLAGPTAPARGLALVSVDY